MPPTTLVQPPEGFHYYPDFLSAADERVLIEDISALEFSAVRMHGITAKRRVAHFGWIYGYESWHRFVRSADARGRKKQDKGYDNSRSTVSLAIR